MNQKIYGLKEMKEKSEQIIKSYRIFLPYSYDNDVYLSFPLYYNIEKNIFLNFFTIFINMSGNNRSQIIKNNLRVSNVNLNVYHFLAQSEEIKRKFIEIILPYLFDKREDSSPYLYPSFFSKNIDKWNKNREFFISKSLNSRYIVPINHFFLFILNFFIFLKKNKNLLEKMGYDYYYFENKYEVLSLYNSLGITQVRKSFTLDREVVYPIGYYVSKLEEIYNKYGIDPFYANYNYSYNFYIIAEMNKFFAIENLSKNRQNKSKFFKNFEEYANSDRFFYAHVGNALYFTNNIDDNEEYKSIIYFCIRIKYANTNIQKKVEQIKEVFQSTKRKNKRFYRAAAYHGVRHTYFIPMRDDGEEIENLFSVLGIAKNGISEDNDYMTYFKRVDIEYFRDIKNFLISS